MELSGNTVAVNTCYFCELKSQQQQYLFPASSNENRGNNNSNKFYLHEQSSTVLQKLLEFNYGFLFKFIK